MLQAGRPLVRFPLRSLDCLNPLNPSSLTMALGFTQTPREMSIRHLPGGNAQPERKADNLTAICQPIVERMWESRRLTIPWDFTACYRGTFSATLRLNVSDVEKLFKSVYRDG
jgi:hypothetical protein